MWQKYSEKYPNGLKRTSFMCRLDGQFKYKEDLGGLCVNCDFYGYQVFESLISLINKSNLMEITKKDFIKRIELDRRHLKRGMENELKVLDNGYLEHSPCINHCLLYAFNECQEQHDLCCEKCSSIFIFLKELRKLFPDNIEEINEYEDKLLFYIAHQIRKKYLNSQYNVELYNLTEDGAILICDYKMKVNPRSARETKQDFFGKGGWTLHTILVITKSLDTKQKLIVRAFDHWSDDNKQDAWFTVSAFDAVFSQIENNIKWISIFSDNGGHYHNSELMVLITHWYSWYNIEVKKWQFLEAGEAKTIVDSHHAQLSHGFVRYTRLGHDISSGEDIVEANKNLSGTSFGKLETNRDNRISVGTIPGIINIH